MTIYLNATEGLNFDDVVKTYAKEYLTECKKVLVVPLDTHGNRVEICGRWVDIDY